MGFGFRVSGFVCWVSCEVFREGFMIEDDGFQD